MTNKRRNLQKLFKCTVCGLADYKQFVPGSLTFFDRCTFTTGCAGRLYIDGVATITPRNELSWQQTSVLYKKEFHRQRVIVIQHDFNHIGSIIVEVFVDANATATETTRIKLNQFTVIEQTATTVTIDLLTAYTGTVVVTDNQYQITTSQTVAQEAWSPPTLLTNGILSLAADIAAPSFPLSILYKSLDKPALQTESVTMSNHTTRAVTGTLWDGFRVIALEKPYYLYSVQLPSHILQKGTSIQLIAASTFVLPTIIFPMAVAEKTALCDVIRNRVIRNSVIRMGDLVIDDNDVFVVNYSIVEELRKPFVIY